MNDAKVPSARLTDAGLAPASRGQPQVWMWRHPRAADATGRCIGRTDLPVDPRRAKRLAHRIRAAARLNSLPRRVFTSPLQRSRDVGRWLRRWGWHHEVQPLLLEMDFGHWDGRPWSDIPLVEIDTWCADFAEHRPGNGESLRSLFDRAARWTAAPGMDCIIVGHGGWMLARRWLSSGQPLPLHSSQWPAGPRHGELWRLPAQEHSKPTTLPVGEQDPVNDSPSE